MSDQGVKWSYGVKGIDNTRPCMLYLPAVIELRYANAGEEEGGGEARTRRVATRHGSLHSG